MSDQKKPGIKLGGLWLSKNGKGGMSGKLGFARLVIFPNTRKTPGSNQPDFDMVLFEDERPADKAAPSEAAQAPRTGSDDDVPF